MTWAVRRDLALFPPPALSSHPGGGEPRRWARCRAPHGCRLSPSKGWDDRVSAPGLAAAVLPQLLGTHISFLSFFNSAF